LGTSVRRAPHFDDLDLDVVLRSCGHRSDLPFGFDQRRKARVQRDAGLVQTGFDGTGSHAELERRLGVSQSLPVERQHGGALARSQRRDRLPHAVGDVGRRGLIRRTRSAVRVLAGEGTDDRSTEPATGRVDGDPRVPGTEAFGAAQAVEPDQRADRGVLHGVGRHGLVADQALNDPPHDRPMPVHQAREGILVSTAGRGHEVGIRRRAIGSSHTR
jgi:hypothetical protein